MKLTQFTKSKLLNLYMIKLYSLLSSSSVQSVSQSGREEERAKGEREGNDDQVGWPQVRPRQGRRRRRLRQRIRANLDHPPPQRDRRRGPGRRPGRTTRDCRVRWKPTRCSAARGPRRGRRATSSTSTVSSLGSSKVGNGLEKSWP